MTCRIAIIGRLLRVLCWQQYDMNQYETSLSARTLSVQCCRENAYQRFQEKQPSGKQEKSECTCLDHIKKCALNNEFVFKYT